MILQFLATLLIGLINALTSFFPLVTTIPFVDSYLVTGIGYIRFIGVYFPPLLVILQMFLYYIVFVKIPLKVIAMIPIMRGFLHK